LGDQVAGLEEQLVLPVDHLVFSPWEEILIMDKKDL
jgi:hypothetical protein